MAYTQKQIDNDRKHYLKEQIENANQLLKDTEGTQLCWEVSCNYGNGVKKFNEGIIEICETEKDAKSILKDMKKEGCVLFYRPIVIDSDDGTTVNFQNLHYYKKGSYFVKSLNNYLNS